MFPMNTLDKLRNLNNPQIENILLRIADVSRIFGIEYKDGTLYDVAQMLIEIERINSNEADLIWDSPHCGYRFVILWKGKRYGVFTDLPVSLHVPIALMDENDELVTHVVVTRWVNQHYMPETVLEYTGQQDESWFIRAHSVPDGYSHERLESYQAYRLVKFEWNGQSYFMRNPSTIRQALLPVCLPGIPNTFLQASSINSTHPMQLNVLYPVEWKGGSCNFAVRNREVRM